MTAFECSEVITNSSFLSAMSRQQTIEHPDLIHMTVSCLQTTIGDSLNRHVGLIYICSYI